MTISNTPDVDHELIVNHFLYHCTELLYYPLILLHFSSEPRVSHIVCSHLTFLNAIAGGGSPSFCLMVFGSPNTILNNGKFYCF